MAGETVITVVGNLFYVLVYTMLLKRRTSQNIVWGGAAGCMPVLIGWSAVTGRSARWRGRSPRCSWPAASTARCSFCSRCASCA